MLTHRRSVDDPFLQDCQLVSLLLLTLARFAAWPELSLALTLARLDRSVAVVVFVISFPILWTPGWGAMTKLQLLTEA